MQNEQSTNAGGLPVYPSKFLIPLAFTLLLIQGLSELIKRIAIIRGDLEDTVSGADTTRRPRRRPSASSRPRGKRRRSARLAEPSKQSSQ